MYKKTFNAMRHRFTGMFYKKGAISYQDAVNYVRRRVARGSASLQSSVTIFTYAKMPKELDQAPSTNGFCPLTVADDMKM